MTLVLERAVNASVPRQPRERATLEPLQDIIARDLRIPANIKAGEEPPPSPAERARRLLDT